MPSNRDFDLQTRDMNFFDSSLNCNIKYILHVLDDELMITRLRVPIDVLIKTNIHQDQDLKSIFPDFRFESMIQLQIVRFNRFNGSLRSLTLLCYLELDAHRFGLISKQEMHRPHQNIFLGNDSLGFIQTD